VRYVATVGVQRDGSRVRVRVRLIDAGTRSVRWADRYDRHLRDIFAVQDEVAEQIAGVLAAHVSRAERERAERKPPETLQAYDYYLRALDQSRMWHSSDASVAEQMLEKAIELAPDFAAAHAALTNYLVSGWLEPEDARWGNPTTLDHAWRSACAAIESDAYLPAAHAAMGWVQFWRHEPDIAIDCYRRAQELNPSFADGHYGHVLSVAGFPKEGHQALLRTRLLDPFHPPMLLGWLGHCHLLLDQPDKALACLRKCTMLAPGWRPAHVWRAAACTELGLADEARAAVAEVLRIDPHYNVSAWQRMHCYRDDRRASTIGRSLLHAGLPDGTP
jgi:adenylate cyclase